MCNVMVMNSNFVTPRFHGFTAVDISYSFSYSTNLQKWLMNLLCFVDVRVAVYCV